MHCPRCGQQQISQETKFCNRCGFQMGLIPELIANNGVLPQLAELYQGKRGLFTRKNGLIFTVLWFIFWVPFMAAFLGGVLNVDELAAASAIFGVFSSMMFFIISLAFLKRAPKQAEIAQIEMLRQQPHAALHGGQAIGALPAQQSQPAQVYSPPTVGSWRAPDTGEFSRPGSVTDNTTKLLQKDEEL